jgi:hypothetical protein
MEKEMTYMYVPKNKYEKDTPEIQDIVVEWKNGMAKGFRSREEAERYINHVCKKAAPDMNFSIYSDIIKR